MCADTLARLPDITIVGEGELFENVVTVAVSHISKEKEKIFIFNTRFTNLIRNNT